MKPFSKSSHNLVSSISCHASKQKGKKMSIIEEAPGYLQVFADGSIKRFTPKIVSHPSPESFHGYNFKDVTIDPSKPITARLFVPSTPPSASGRFPVVVYFHGGGFCIGSTTWLGYHHFLGDFSVASQSIVLSIDYRLAPEHRLPIAYEDCYSSVEWLYHQVVDGSEPWLAKADLTLVFLSGDSAGGNIAHHVGTRALRNKSLGIEIKGLLLIHPYFGSEKRIKGELDDGVEGHVTSNDMFWRLSIPKGLNRDYFGCNFEMQELSAEEWSQLPRVAVYVAGLDFLKERGVMYAEFLKSKGVKEVKLVEEKNEGHVFHVFDPKCEATGLLQRQMTEFMKSY